MLALGCLTACGTAADTISETIHPESSTATESNASAAQKEEPIATDKEIEALVDIERKIDKKALRDLLGRETANALIRVARTDPDAAWIATHPKAYEKYGPELQVKLLKLAADDPLAIPFVRGFPKRAYADKPNPDAPAMDEKLHVKGVPNTKFPHLYQWDLRWGYTNFSQDGFGLAACGPTSLTMVYRGLTGKTDLTPHDMGRLAEEQGYVIYGAGSTSGLFLDLPIDLGLHRWEIPVDAASIKETLSAGYPIIANVGAGYFSQVGHFFVLAGITDDGKVILNDPYSVERSSKLWDAELIAAEAKALYAYSAE